MLSTTLYLWDSTQFYIDSSNLEELQKGVQRGEPLAYYALARYYSTVRPEADSVEFAVELFYRAADAGVVDAEAALALLWRSGDMGIVDLEKSQQMLDEAFEMGSLLAAKVVLTDMICGIYRERDIKTAMTIIDERISQKDSSLWCYLKGLAIHQSADILSWDEVCPQAAEWYRRAIEEGVSDAYQGLLEVSALDYFGNIVDADRYIDIACEGAAAGCAKMIYAVAKYEYDICYSCSEKQSEDWYRQICEDFESALSRGCANAAYYLGQIYYREEDNLDAAWAYYVKGATLGSVECYEAIYDLMDKGIVTESDEFKAHAALYGTRCGSWHLVRVVIELYQAGYLHSFASEIENYYMPRLHRLEELERSEITI